MVLNEPETSLHPDLLPPLARLIAQAAERSQIIVVTHAAQLIAALREYPCNSITLEKSFGETKIAESAELNLPASWKNGSARMMHPMFGSSKAEIGVPRYLEMRSFTSCGYTW